MTDQQPGESWEDWYQRTKPARLAGQDQGVAEIRDKLRRILPELDADPDKARQRMTLVLRAAVPTAGVEAMCEVLADYVVRERDRGEQPAPAEVKKVLLPVEDEGLDEERPEIDEVTVVYAKDDPADPERRKT